MANNKLKAYVRYDGTGRIIPGSLILNRFKPKVGNWQEIDANECCNYTPSNTFNFDITASDWENATPGAVVDENSFKSFLESGNDGDNDLTNVVITDFSLVGGRLRCNLSATGTELYLGEISVTEYISCGNITGLTTLDLNNTSLTSIDDIVWPSGLEYLSVNESLISSFNPTQSLPNSLQTLDLRSNQIVIFDPSITLPSGLKVLYLDDNQLTSFDPSIALPTTLDTLYLQNNQITNFTPSLPLPSSLIDLNLENNQIVNFNPAHDLPDGIIVLKLRINQIVNFTPSNSLGIGLKSLNLDYNQIVNFDPGVALPSSLERIDLSNNQIITFDPSIALPIVSGPYFELFLSDNQIITFNPSIALPSGLTLLSLNNNQIVTFNPSIPLPDSLVALAFFNNQMTTAGYTASEPWANAMSVIPARGNVYFNNNINSASGTNLETILIAKGWTVNV